MAAPIRPSKVTSKKKDTWWFVPALSSMTAPSKVEIDAVGALNITCYLLSDQGGVVASANKVSLPPLLCEDNTSEVTDTVNHSLSDIVGTFNPQAASGHDDKKAWELFGRSGASGYLVRRQGVLNDVEATVTVGEFVDVFSVDINAGTPDKTANDATGIYAFTCSVDLVDHEFNVAVVA